MLPAVVRQIEASIFDTGIKTCQNNLSAVSVFLAANKKTIKLSFLIVSFQRDSSTRVQSTHFAVAGCSEQTRVEIALSCSLTELTKV